MPCRWVTLCLLIAAVLTAAQSHVRADPNDWPQWRGPHRDGISAETGLLKRWPDGGPKLLWKAADLGGGYSTPSVSNGRIYLLGDRSGEEYLVALDAKDGKPIWSTQIGAVGPNTMRGVEYPGTRSTPTVDGEAIYALGSDGDLVCMDTASGKLRWRKNLKTEFKGAPGSWAYAESPLVDGEVVIGTPGGTEATLVAFNKKTGDVIWKSAIPASDDARNGWQAGYSSAVVADVGGVKQYVQFIASGVVGVDAKTGKLLWRYNMPGNMNTETPVLHDNCVYVAEGGNGPKFSALVKLTADGQAVTATKVYQVRDLPNHHGGVVRIGDYVYGTSDNQLVCQEFKTGKVMWQDRSVGKGAITAAEGMLYLRGERGPVALVEATPEGYKERGRFNQPDRQRTSAWPHPVIANGRLYLRDGNILLCYDIKAN
jgi:outer membrane protein assembly factor BamB